MTLRIAHRCRAKLGEVACGDAVVVRRADPITLFAVVDGLGHGERAEEAARSCVDHLAAAPLSAMKDLVNGVHRRLRGTRGAAATICTYRGGVLEGCGVGNVELRATGTRVPAALTPGILGAQLGSLRVFRASLSPGDRVALFSDGVSRQLSLESVADRALEDACGLLFEQHAGGSDDATLLLAEVCA